jgi:hypothetical protein
MTSHPDHPLRAQPRARGAAPTRRRPPSLPLLTALLLTTAVGCAPLSGTTSLTVLSAEKLKGLEPIAYTAEETACTNWLLTLFIWGDPSSHETLVARLIERTGADALVDAKLESSSWGFPYLFMRGCASVRGLPAKRVARAE